MAFFSTPQSITVSDVKSVLPYGLLTMGEININKTSVILLIIVGVVHTEVGFVADDREATGRLRLQGALVQFDAFFHIDEESQVLRNLVGGRRVRG